MTKNRMEAFSDGVLAIIITIMVLELHAPAEPTWAALRPEAPTFVSYVLSFVYVGIYWSNHHHLLHAARTTSGGVLWANLHLLFWLSLIPFVTGWMGRTLFAPLPVAFYGAVLLMAAVAYLVLALLLIRLDGPDSVVAQAAGPDRKGVLSIACYAAAVPLAFVNPYVSCALYVVVALLWLIPDRHIETRIHE